MRPRMQMQTQQQYAQGQRPVTMPQSVGSGLAQTAVGAFASLFANMGQRQNDEIAVRYADAIQKSPYLIADYLEPKNSIQDILSPDNWSGNINEYLA
jgi:hypothetical protein